MIGSANKYKELVNDVANLQKAELTSISEQAANIKYRFSVLITDKQINEDKSLFEDVRAVFGTAADSITLTPFKPTVPVFI